MRGIVNGRIWACMVIALTIAVAGILLPDCSFANSGVEINGGAIVLTVCQDGVQKETFTQAELEALGTETHTYSAFNSFPSPQIAKDVKGVTIASVLQAAGIDPGTIGEKQIIEIEAGDGVKEAFMKEQLLANRYCFPNFRNEAGRQGKAPLSSSWNSKIPVPAMISLKEPNGNADQVGRLLIGQVSPTEQNYSCFLKYVLKGGKINVCSQNARKWNAIRAASPAGGSVLERGTAITFDRSINTDPSIFTNRYCIYYTTDGTEPTMGSALYNYNNYNFGSVFEKFNKPIISQEGVVTIRTKVIGYGLQDSAVSILRYTGYNRPAAPKIRKIKAKKKAIALKWTKVGDAQGYVIYRASKKSGQYKPVKAIGKNGTLSWTNKKLKKKKTYYYKIRAYKNVGGQIVYSSDSAVKKKRTK